MRKPPESTNQGPSPSLKVKMGLFLSIYLRVNYEKVSAHKQLDVEHTVVASLRAGRPATKR